MTQLLLLILCCLLLSIITAKANGDDDDATSAALASSLFTRYDRKANNIAAGNHFKSTTTTADEDEIKYYDNLDKDTIKRQQIMRQNKKKSNDDNNINSQKKYSDPNNKCTTYLAPSSIPNSGLGMYTTIPYTKGDLFPLPEIGIMLHDKDAHYPQGSHSLLTQYPWGARILSGGFHEVTTGSSMVPGLGMLANSHLGLVNMRHSDSWSIQRTTDGTESLVLEGLQSSTLDDVGRGSTSYHSRILFDVTKNIQGGEELFVNYGDEWFTAREGWIGVIPSKKNYEEADRLIESLFHDVTVEEEGHDEDVFVDISHAYEVLLKDAEKKDKRLRAAFPDKFEDVPLAKEIGTARFSARTSVQSIEWIEENGVCIDNIVSGTSTIPQAGRGAFATRTINKGAVISTTPLITLEREQLQLWEEVNGEDVVGVVVQNKQKEEDKVILEMVGHQLLLNYCYGHVNSSLILFPYSPTVNFINHGSMETANAEIRWSSYPYHKREWLNLSIQEMKELKKTGLMFDIVATKDIHLGEEVLLYYGKEWEDSWSEHIEDWISDENEQGDVIRKNVTDTLGVDYYTQSSVSDSVIWTVEEQKNNRPYPHYLETICRFEPPAESCRDESSNNYYCKIRWSLTSKENHDHPCDVISRVSTDGNDWYFVHLNITNSTSNETTQYHVEFLPRYAIRLTNRKYTKDQYSRGVFREVIGLPDGLYPDHWMDLKEDDEEYKNIYTKIEAKRDWKGE
jgi:hypothetical protein